MRLTTDNGSGGQGLRFVLAELQQLARRYGADDISIGRTISIHYHFDGTEFPIDKVVRLQEEVSKLGGTVCGEKEEEYSRYTPSDVEGYVKSVIERFAASEVPMTAEVASNLAYERLAYERLVVSVLTGRRYGILKRTEEEAEIYATLSRRTFYNGQSALLMTHASPFVAMSVDRKDLTSDNVRNAVDLMGSLFRGA